MLPFWQLVAALFATVLALLGVGALIRAKGPLLAVVTGLLVAVPFLGFAAYAIVPGRTPEAESILLAWIPTLIALSGGIALAASTAGRQPLTWSRIAGATAGTIALWGGLVVALSIVLAQWQPIYAIANIALNAAWLIVWIPRRTRQFSTETTVEIRAPASRVYEFISQPSNWPLFNEDAVAATTSPAGELGVGHKITVVTRYEAPVRGPRMLPDTVEAVAIVTALIPEQLIATRAAAGGSSVAYAFTSTDAGTGLAIRLRVAIPYPIAIIGGVFGLLTQRSARIAKARRNLARLKELLEKDGEAV